ncbi:hypothetical protein AB0M46_02110 [Dactylosporangium sp. NPDC051485]|uniref:alpha/beta fold hydrolase n=1 Tax=Dactylosporangium sp. NPDC051485 TaxID=3154846 RepID=UPI0034198DB6
MTASRSGHLPVDGLRLHHEVHDDPTAATAPPLPLIPGPFLGADSMRQRGGAFAPRRPVVVFDQQGHGRTPDTERPMSYERFTDDTALLHGLGIAS